MTSFTDLSLAPPLQAALDALGYTTPTPIQLQAIPPITQGRDLMGIAQTGTGKTAAFALPSLHHICQNQAEPPKRGARILVLAPTRELASQIAVSYRDYGRKIETLSVTCVFGGVPISRQIKRLVSGNDVLVATPGRLIDLLDRKAITLGDIEILILDEADQMMDMGFIHALKKIVPLLPKERQTLFFSATMVPAIKKLAAQFLNDPIAISVTPANTTAERVKQSVIFADKSEKQALLTLALLKPDVNRALVFTRTKHGADRVVKRLAATGIRALAIHGNKSQSQRQRALQAFRDGTVTTLIATDIAARGIDIEGISHVFNFEIPNVPEQYVHRIGRTARANTDGHAIAFVSKDERKYFKDIQKLLKMDIPVEKLPENFIEQAKNLAKRPALPPEPKPEPTPRKGRGKSTKKRKGRFTKSKQTASDGARREDRPEARANLSGYDSNNPSEPRKKHKRKSKPAEKKAAHNTHKEEKRDTRSKGKSKFSKKPTGQTQSTEQTQSAKKPKKKKRGPYKSLAEQSSKPKKPHERYGRRRKNASKSSRPNKPKSQGHKS